MNRPARTVLVIVAGVAAFAATNLFCWRPGVGPARVGTGTELERVFGWPGQWRADIWQADDPDLQWRIVRQAPFFLPQDEMVRRVVRTSVASLCLNAVAFGAVTAVAAYAVANVGVVRRARRRRAVTVVGLIVAIATAVVSRLMAVDL